MLVSLQEVGSIIGKKGEIVKRFREEVSTIHSIIYQLYTKYIHRSVRKSDSGIFGTYNKVEAPLEHRHRYGSIREWRRSRSNLHKEETANRVVVLILTMGEHALPDSKKGPTTNHKVT